MGTVYKYILYEDSDWYGQSKKAVIDAIKKELPVAEILSAWSHYIVIDLDKNSPWSDNAQRLKKYCDQACYYTDSAQYELRKVEFKPDPEDKITEDNKPANRNAKYIEQARKEWMSRWKSAQTSKQS